MAATFFYLGYSPVAPGTAASLTGGILYLLLSPYPYLCIIFFVVIVILGFSLSGTMERYANIQDPSCVVIDEVAGSFIAFFMLPLHLPVMVSAFFLFRAFDMFKIFPVNYAEKIGGSWGIMLDDIVAGIYANLVMQAAVRLSGLG